MVFCRSTTQGFVQITLPVTPRIRSALHTISVSTKFISKIRLKSSSFYSTTLYVALISVMSLLILHSLSLEVFMQNRFLIFRCSRVHLRLYYIGWVHERVAPPASARCGLVACSPGLLAERGGAHTEHAYRSVPANHNPPLTLKHTLGRIEWRIFLFLETIAQLLFHFLFEVTFLNCIAFIYRNSFSYASLIVDVYKQALLTFLKFYVKLESWQSVFGLNLSERRKRISQDLQLDLYGLNVFYFFVSKNV